MGTGCRVYGLGAEFGACVPSKLIESSISQKSLNILSTLLYESPQFVFINLQDGAGDFQGLALQLAVALRRQHHHGRMSARQKSGFQV